MKVCPACMEELPDDAQFCGVCGFHQAPLAGGQGREIVRAPQVLSPDMGEEDDGATPRRPLHDLAWAATERGVVPLHRQDERPRELRRFPLKVRVGLDRGHDFLDGTSDNISAGGIFICTSLPATIGEELEVRFSLPLLESTLSARGVVAWQRDAETEDGPRGLGVRFVALTPQVEAAIVAFIQHRDPAILGKEGE